MNRWNKLWHLKNFTLHPATTSIVKAFPGIQRSSEIIRITTLKELIDYYSCFEQLLMRILKGQFMGEGSGWSFLSLIQQWTISIQINEEIPASGVEGKSQVN